MFKTVFVDAYHSQEYKQETYEEPTGEVKTGLLGRQVEVKEKKTRWVPTGNYSDRRIDGGRLANDLETALAQLDADGYDVVAVTPVTSGRYGWQEYSRSAHTAANTAVSWGFSVTEGFMITARKSN